jgi:phosphohistidine swiveling domain-containing protein
VSKSYDDQTHSVSGADTLWTRVNTSEATPGVITPLHWDFFRSAERGMRASAYDRGVYDESEIELPASVDDNWTGAFFGRVALNVDALREMYDRVPGTSADEFELTMLGSVRPDARRHPTTERHPRIIERRNGLLAEIPRTIERLYVEFDAWWKAGVRPDTVDDVDGAAARWLEARDRLGEVMRPHTTASLFAMEGYASLARACATAGKLDLLTRLTSGYGDTEDDRLSEALWDAAHNALPHTELITRYGYQGDRAGDLAARVWREDPTVLDPVLAALESMDEREGPRATRRHRVAARADAEAELLAALEPGQRGEIRNAMAETHRFTALRQLGKVTFWRAVDVGRAATRTLGRAYCARGLLTEPDDAYFLAADELVPTLAPDADERAAFRRARHREYEAVEIPITWVGNPVPQPVALAADADRVSVITGIGVSPGVVEGRARVVVDPTADDRVEPGEILVCHTTDPSWAGYFLVASALVIDVGGPLSHGAIVARELGVPCVIKTNVGTTQLVSGDMLRVDGDTGRVEVLVPTASRREA